MKSIIICEGKTDLILLSYYLCKTTAWTHLRGKEAKGYQDRLLTFKVDNPSTQEFNWYVNSDADLLCIYAVGSINQISSGLKQVVDINLLSNSEPFDKVIIICDRDDNTVEKNLFKGICDVVSPHMTISSDLSNNTWTGFSYDVAGKTETLKLLPLIIPFDEVGTLETFLLNCRRTIDTCECDLVNKCEDFIDGIQNVEAICNRYMSRRGIRPKILLGAYFSVVSPNRTFDVGNEILTSVNWEEYSNFNKTFECLLQL